MALGKTALGEMALGEMVTVQSFLSTEIWFVQSFLSNRKMIYLCKASFQIEIEICPATRSIDYHAN
jgi:hypothetical protein